MDFAAGEVRLGGEETKNGKPRVFPMSALPALMCLMREQRARTERLERAQSRIIPVVFHRDGVPIKYFGDAWATVCRKAGKPGLLVHDLRGSAARRWSQAGLPDRVGMSLGGWVTRSMYDRYGIVSQTDLPEGVAKPARRN